MFKCDCGRAYLSALALSNHRKSKHLDEELEINFGQEESKSDENGKKKRGRPKKNSEFKISSFPEMHYNLFFENELRKKRNGENIIIKNFAITIFNEFFFYLQPKDQVKNTLIKNVNNHPFLIFILKNENYTFSNISTCDQIFLKYLDEISNYTNEEYFKFVFKFIVLFRECINKYKNIELENSIIILNEKVPKEVKEFTQFYDAEQVPELCNEFLTDYLESNDFFGIKDDYMPEFIPIIQHFCFWLFYNNYTSSRLSLVGTD
jgi:hypothetical protein